MPDQEPRMDSKRWGQQLQDVTERVEQDVKRVVSFINNEVVPDIRRNGSQALRSAAAELQKLAERMEDQRASAPVPPRDANRP